MVVENSLAVFPHNRKVQSAGISQTLQEKSGTILVELFRWCIEESGVCITNCDSNFADAGSKFGLYYD